MFFQSPKDKSYSPVYTMALQEHSPAYILYFYYQLSSDVDALETNSAKYRQILYLNFWGIIFCGNMANALVILMVGW